MEIDQDFFAFFQRCRIADQLAGEGVDGLLGADLGVFRGDGRLALAPALDALEQRAAHVPARLAGGKGGVEVNVRLDEGRHHQIAAGIEVIRAEGRRFGLTGDAADQAVFKVQLVQAFLVAQAGVDDVHRASPFSESCRQYLYVSSPAAIPASSIPRSEMLRLTTAAADSDPRLRYIVTKGSISSRTFSRGIKTTTPAAVFGGMVTPHSFHTRGGCFPMRLNKSFPAGQINTRIFPAFCVSRL